MIIQKNDSWWTYKVSSLWGKSLIRINWASLKELSNNEKIHSPLKQFKKNCSPSVRNDSLSGMRKQNSLQHVHFSSLVMRRKPNVPLLRLWNCLPNIVSSWSCQFLYCKSPKSWTFIPRTHKSLRILDPLKGKAKRTDEGRNFPIETHLYVERWGVFYLSNGNEKGTQSVRFGMWT